MAFPARGIKTETPRVLGAVVDVVKTISDELVEMSTLGN